MNDEIGPLISNIMRAERNASFLSGVVAATGDEKWKEMHREAEQQIRDMQTDLRALLGGEA